MKTTEPKIFFLAMALLCFWASFASQSHAQTGGPYDLTWNTTDGGGSTSANGGAYNLGGTVGQHDAGASSGGAYSLTGGFWGGANTPATLQLTTALSRKTHGGAGDFDIPLPLSGSTGVECRSSGGAHRLVFTFSNNVVSGNASLTSGTGSVSGSPTFSGNAMTVNLAGVTDVQKITVTLSGVTDSFGQSLPNTAVSMNMVIGDSSGNSAVNSADVAQTKSRTGQPVSATNFRSDVNANGSLNASDVSQVKANSGHAVP